MFRKYRIITVLIIVLLLAACTASQAKPSGWSFRYWYDYMCPCWVITIDFHLYDSASPLAVSGFQFDIQSDPTQTSYESGSLQGLPPFQSSITDLGGGLFRVSGAASGGALPPPGEVDLITIDFLNNFGDITNPVPPPIPLFTVSAGPNGYALLSDGTLLGPNDIDPISSVPEPSGLLALFSGVAAFGGILMRKRK